ADQTEKDCDYSFYVSVALMVRQFFHQPCPLTIHLSGYMCSVKYCDPRTGNVYESDVAVTAASVVTLDYCETETRIDGMAVDIAADVGSARLLFRLDYPQRGHAVEPIARGHPDTGVVV